MAFIIDEHFTTGARPPGWWSGSVGDFGYATAPAPLEGAFSLQAATSGQALYIHGSVVTGEQWGHFIFNIPALPSVFQRVFDLQNSGTSEEVIRITVFADGHLEVTDSGGTANAATASGISAATTYHMWFRYKPTTTDNGELELWFNTADDRAGTPSGQHALATNGHYTGGADYFQLIYNTGDNKQFLIDVAQWANTDMFTGAGAAVPFFTQLNARVM